MKYLRRIRLTLNIILIDFIIYMGIILATPFVRLVFTFNHLRKTIVEIWRGDYDKGATHKKGTTYPTDIRNVE